MIESQAQCSERWTNRRRMAWWAFRLLALQTTAAFVIAWYKPAAMEPLSGIIIGASTAWVGIIMVYIGAATYDDVQSGKGLPQDRGAGNAGSVSGG